MNRSLYFSAGPILLGLVLTTSCRTMADTHSLSLPRLVSQSDAPAATTRLAGVLTRDGDCLRVGGHGGGGTAGINGVVIWPVAGDGPGVASDINVIVIWPRSATVQHRGGSDAAGINGVVIWCLSDARCRPVRIGERVELVGGMKDDVSGLHLAQPLPRGCTGPIFVVREFRPAPTS
jgi:hypothetical protein